MIKRPAEMIACAGLMMALLGCSLLGGQATPGATETPTTLPTELTLAPTLPPATPTLEPSPTSNLAPTAIPAPTEIPPPTAAPANLDQTGTPGSGGSGDPGITLNPAVGEPRDVIVVAGTSFAPGEKVALHWNAADLKAPTGPVYFEVMADANGFFSVGLKVPPADQWPGGSPKEHDLIQLRATSPSLGFNWRYANFTYIKRFNPQATAPPGTPTATP